MAWQELSAGSERLGEIQKKTFTRWINEQFRQSSVPLSVQDLYQDLRDGRLLFSLVSTLTGQSVIEHLVQDSTALDRIKHLLNFLQKQNVKLKSNEVTAEGVNNGDRKNIHSLLWAIISRWHVEVVLKNLHDSNAETDQLEAPLLEWCQKSTQGYTNVTVCDFTASWRDGLAFNALIYKYCPDLFNFDVLLAKDNVARLNHAFAVSHRKLHVPLILDADDVDIECPEKCSIIIYLVYLYEAVTQQKAEKTKNFGSSGKSFVRYSMPVFSAKPENGLCSREVSQDFGGFMGSVGETLAWLLDASHTLSNQSPVAKDMDGLKDQFHQHEKFMVQLTQRQNSIGNALQEGNHLLAEGLLTSEEEAQVERQMALLNNRWEELRLQAMDRQTRLQQSLMSEQQQQLDSLSQWLTSMEHRIQKIKTSSGGGDCEESVRLQIEEQNVLQAEIEHQQQDVTNLQSMVVVVDETNSESAYLALEQQLEGLGSRWTDVCQWVEERALMLQEALSRWQGFNERLKDFTTWLTQTEEILSDMNGICDSEIKEVVEYVQRLKGIENEMDEMMKCFDELNDFGLELVQYIGNNETGIKRINGKLLECQERWDNLVQSMELKGKEIVHSGIELKISRTSTGSQAITVSKKGEEPVTVSISPSAAAARPSSAKRPRIEPGCKKEFDRQVASLSQWLDQIEVTQEIITTEPENDKDRLTIEEQLVLIEDAEKDIKAHESEMNQLRSLGQRLVEELRYGKESTEAIEEVMRRLESRWKRVNVLLVDNMSKVSISSRSQQVYSELSTLQEIVENYERWITSEGPVADEFMELSRQLEHCRVKFKSFQTHESHLNKINSSAKELVSSLDSQSEVLEKYLAELNHHWLRTHQKLSERQTLLTKALQKTPPKSFMDSFLALVHWLDRIEARLETASCDVNTTDIMEGHIVTCKEIQVEMKDRYPSLEYIVLTAQDLIKKAPNEEKSIKLRNNLQKLNDRWSQIQSSGTLKAATLENLLEQLKQYKSQKSEVMNWVEEMELFLTSEEAAIGDVSALQAQLTESDGALEDMKTMKNILDNINLTAEKLRPLSNETFVQQFDLDLELLNKRWKTLVDLSQKHNAKLREDLDLTRKLSNDISAVEQWIDKTVKEFIAREYTVHSVAELAVLRKKFQELSDEMKTSRKSNMEKLDQRVFSIASSATGNSAQELIGKLAKVESKWNEVDQSIEDNREKFTIGEENFAHFKALISQEMNWIGELKEKLAKGSNLSGDAEELSEELDDLESFLATQKVETAQRINELAQALLNNHLMVASVTSDLDSFTNQNKKFMNMAKERIAVLNAAIVAAQNRESQIVEMSQWMTDVVALLQARLDADILAGDTPNEFESLKGEFEQHEAILTEFEKEVSAFREENKVEEAERLEQQLLILRKHYAEVSAKFCKFQRPVDFVPKLDHIKHVLEELEEQIHVLEISNLDPNDLQIQLEQCMKFYKTMSSIKPEVEYVIKTGRQVVEKKQVDHPEQMSTELDSTKQTYNELGAQVTQSKSVLEQTLKLMRIFRSESAMLNDYILGIRNELTERENIELIKDIDDELLWIKTAHLELNKKQPHLSSLSEIAGQLHKIVDESIVAEVDDTAKDLHSQMNDITAKIAHHKITLQDLAEELERGYVDFETTQRELMIWMDNTEDFLNELKSTSEMEQSSIDQVQQLMDEHGQLMCQLDQVRDSAVSIISKSDRYSKIVEPLLTLLNQRWQEVTNRLKDLQSFQIEASAKQRKSPIENASTPAHLCEGEKTDLAEVLPQLQSELEEYNSRLLKDKDKVLDLSGPKANDRLEELRQNEERFQKKINQVISDEALSNAEDLTSESYDKTNEGGENLQALWRNILKESEHQRLAIILSMEDFSEFRQAAEELDQWLNEMEQKLFEAANDEEQIKSLSAALAEKKFSFDDLTKKMHQLRSPYAKSNAFELLSFLNCHFTCLQRQVNLYRKTSDLSPHLFLRKLRVRKVVFTTEKSQFVRDLQGLESMLSDLELELNTPFIEDYQPDLMEAQEDEFKVIEDSLDVIQCSLESAENSKEEALRTASEEERSQVDVTLRDIRTRMTALQKETTQRKISEETLLVSVDLYTSQLDEITLWLNETENVLNDRIGDANREKISKLLDAVKERESHLPEKQTQLRSLSRSARLIFFHPDIVPAAKERIMRDLGSDIDRWNKIVLMLSRKRHIFEERLLYLNLFHEELEKLCLHISSTRVQMDSPQHALAVGHNKVNQDVEVIPDALEVGQCSAERLKFHYKQLESRGKEPGIGVLSPIKQKMDDIITEWTIIYSQAVILQNLSSDKEPTVEKVEETICHAEQSVLTTAESVSITPPELNLTEGQKLDQRAAGLEKAIEEIVQNVLLHRVEIGNVPEIEKAIRNGKVKRVEMETFEKELEAASQLLTIGKMTAEERLQFEKVEKLRQRSEETKAGLTQRSAQLEDMLLECRQFEEMNVEFERWISSLEDESNAQHASVGHTIAALEELIETNKRLQLEAMPWQSRVDSLHGLADKLIDEYNLDDGTKLKTVLNHTDERWTGLLSRLTTQSKMLQNMLNSIYRFDADLKDFLLWLTKVEIVLKHHSDILSHDNSKTDFDQSNQTSEAFKDLQSEIDQHQGTLDSLNSTGNQIVLGLQTEKAEAMLSQLDDMNQRWNRLKTKSGELRNHLDVQVNGNVDGQMNQQVLEVTIWLTQLDSDLDMISTPGGDTAALNDQRDRLKEICLKLEGKRSRVEELLKVGGGESEMFDENQDSTAGKMQNRNEDGSDARKTSNDPMLLLQKKWIDVNHRSIECEKRICQATEKLESVEGKLNDATQFLMLKEMIVSRWVPVAELTADSLPGELNQTKSFHVDFISNQTKIEACRESVNELQKNLECTLSPTNRSRLNNLQEKWSSLESSVEDRLQQIITAMKNYGSGTQYHLSMAVFPPWERSVAEAKVPYYINHSTETTQWDHPEMTRILSSLADLNTVKFSAYRTSMKLRRLQKRFSLDLVSLSKVQEIFDSRGLGQFSVKPMSIPEVIQCLSAIYDSLSPQETGVDVNASLCIDLVLNWLLNLYDFSRTGHIPSLSFRVAILVMCSALLEEKHKALFNAVANADGLVNQQQLGLLLQACVQIPKQLGEIAAFGGSNVDPSIRSCFEKAGNPSDIKVSHFLEWVKLEPQSLVWLPVLHRLIAAESAKHQAKCNACKDCPILGFRYRCLKCFSFNMCQNCFFTGCRAKNHKLNHPMQEYCTTTTSSEDMRDFTKMFKNKFRSKQYFKKHPRLGYLPVQSMEDGDTLERNIITTMEYSSAQTSSPLRTAVANSSSSTPSTGSLTSQNYDHYGSSTRQTAHGASPVRFNSQNSSSVSTSEVHSRLELYANRLAEVEQRRREATPDWDDEHNLISQYCQSLHGNNATHTLQSPMQIMMAMDADQKADLEAMIRDLEDENKLLQAEYDQLKEVHGEELTKSTNDMNGTDFQTANSTDGRDAEMIAEAKLLRQHKGRLEARMQILEDHNYQLDAQLRRLRQLLAEQSESEMRIVTYPVSQSPASSLASQSSLPSRGPPSFASSTRQSSQTSTNGRSYTHGLNGDIDPEGHLEGHLEVQNGSDRLPEGLTGKNNIDNLFQVAEEVGRAVETLVNIMTDDERHTEEEKDLAAKEQQLRKP